MIQIVALTLAAGAATFAVFGFFTLAWGMYGDDQLQPMRRSLSRRFTVAAIACALGAVLIRMYASIMGLWV